MDYSKLNAVVLADKIPKGTAEFDRISMLKRLGFPVENKEINTSDDSLFVNSVKDMLPQPVRLIAYLSPSEGKFKFGSFLSLDKDGAFVNIPIEAIRIVDDLAIFAKKKGDELLQQVKEDIETGKINLEEENNAGKDFDQVETMNTPVKLPESIKRTGRPKKA